MKKFYTAVVLFCFLVVFAVLYYFFGQSIVQIFDEVVSVQENTTIVDEENEVINREEQVELLEELAPENPIDTPEEIREEVERLNELQNTDTQVDVDIFSELQGENNTEAQLRLLQELNSN